MKINLIFLVIFASGFQCYGASLTKNTVFWTLNPDGVSIKSWAWVDGEMDLVPIISLGYGIDINVTGFSHKYKVGQQITGTTTLRIRDEQETIISEFDLTAWKAGESRNLQTQTKYAVKDGAASGGGFGFQFSLGLGEESYTENYNGLTLTKPCPEP